MNPRHQSSSPAERQVLLEAIAAAPISYELLLQPTDVEMTGGPRKRGQVLEGYRLGTPSMPGAQGTGVLAHGCPHGRCAQSRH
jgi:hypothetical protein